MTISMQDLETGLLSTSCPFSDVLKRVSARGPWKVCVSVCVLYVCERERQRDQEGKQERRNMSEFVLLRHHTLRPKESMPGAV